MYRALGSAWGAVAALRAAAYERGWLRRHRLARPVISIGALSVGGAGKTPATAAICGLLLEAGYRPAILSRGYRRRTRGPLLVSAGDGRGPVTGPDSAGDEPSWLARALPGAVVAVATAREQAAELALAAAPVDVFVLDDGFQHLRVERDADLLLVDAAAPYWEDNPLPAGRLRELPGAAARADAFLVAGSERGPAVAGLRQRLPGRPTFGLEPEPPQVWESTAYHQRVPIPPPQPVDTLRGPLLAFAGIARPERFFSDLAEAGIEVATTRRFPDHHRYSEADVSALIEAAPAAGAVALVTTEKDATRIAGGIGGAVCHVWRHRLRVVEESSFSDWLTATVRRPAESGASALRAARAEPPGRVAAGSAPPGDDRR